MTRETLDKLRAMGMNLGPQYDRLADTLTQNRLDTEEAKINAKTFLSIKYISSEENLLNHLITFSIEGKNVKNTNGFISLLDAKTSTIISTIEVKIENRGISKQFSFIKNNLFTYNPQEVIAKLYCDGNFAETKKFQIRGLKKVKTCYCNRDFTVDEMQTIVEGIRDNTFYNNKPISEYHGDKLFAKEIDLEESQKTYKKFTQVINDAFGKYKINTCLRKRHFLAQAYWETGYFTRLKESGDNLVYDPYRGRGFMQLTGNYNKITKKVKAGIEDSRTKNATAYLGYKKYSGINVVDDPDLISNSIYNSADSGGWFWVYGKVISDGSILDLNTFADEDKFDKICELVNGGVNGKQERTDANEALKKIIPYENCKNYKKK